LGALGQGHLRMLNRELAKVPLRELIQSVDNS
jgi:hypothetical protein